MSNWGRFFMRHFYVNSDCKQIIKNLFLKV